MKSILTNDKKHLTLFADNIAIDKRLPKWRNAEEGISKPKVSSVSLYEIGTGAISNINTPIGETEHPSTYNDFDPDAHIDASVTNVPLYKTPDGIDFNELATLGIKELTKYTQFFGKIKPPA